MTVERSGRAEISPGGVSGCEPPAALSSGASDLGRLLRQFARVTLRSHATSPAARTLQLWAAEVEKRRGKGVAIVALARKLAGILFALWRDGTEFKSC